MNAEISESATPWVMFARLNTTGILAKDPEVTSHVPLCNGRTRF